jgi:hypothetical protein
MDNVKTVRTIIKAFIDGDIPLLLTRAKKRPLADGATSGRH